MPDVLDIFQKETKEWFLASLGEPTPVQQEAWPVIASGKHTLVSAPTGTGKTLSAFLVFLDKLQHMAREGSLEPALWLIYISPLKSLAADIRENLRRPLAGIGAESITVNIRTGDTSTSERQRMIRKPPHILITTPESLYLMLTSKTGQNILATAKAVILDELHALIDTKRGAHLMLSLARLDLLCGRPLQRIGLSATIEPLSTAAGYLAPEEVCIVSPAMKKDVRLDILSPYADNASGRRKDPVWEKLSSLVYQHCLGSRSVIAFVEGRRYAEKLAYYVNLLGGDGFARVHHGSLSREQRAETEAALRNGTLRLLCATSSMELGIDVGEIDQVLQVGCPRTISGTMQRLGRAGHNPGRESVMYLFPRTAAECITCGMTAQLAREGGVEHLNPPSECLDILAQHLVSMAAFRSYELSEVMRLLPRAKPFCHLTKDDVISVLSMLAGDYEHERDIPARPRILFDRIHERVEGDSYTRMLAVSAGGTIPDRGLYTVKTEEGVKLGEIDEEFVYESQKGDRFILGSFAWRVLSISRDTVMVTQAPVEGARLPFWKGEIKGRDRRTGEAFGRMLRSLQEASMDGNLPKALEKLGLDKAAVSLAAGYLTRQLRITGSLPDDRTIIAEHFKDASGNSQVMFHSIFGRRINAPLALLTAETAREALHMEIGYVDEEDGFLLYSYGAHSLPSGLLQRVNPETCLRKLEILLPATPLFNIAFRYNCGRALMMGVRKNSRQPLWMQRLRSSEMLNQLVKEEDHPLIRETRRECMQELWDSRGVLSLLHDICSGFIKIREVYTETPSPMSLPLQWGQEAAVMYDYTPTPRGIHSAVEEALRQDKELIAPGKNELSALLEHRRLPEDKKQLHSLLMTEGDLAAGELAIPAEWLDSLAREGRALYLEQGLWIAAEHEESYTAAFGDAAGRDGTEERLHIIRRMLCYRGAADAIQTSQRYDVPVSLAEECLDMLCRRGEAVAQDGLYYHARLFRQARVQTLKNRRAEIQTCPFAAYAALLFSRTAPSAPAEECLKDTLRHYAGFSLPSSLWENVLLPAYVKGYRENMLDAFLAEGELFWHMEENGDLRFDYQEEIDWDADPACQAEELTGKELILYDALRKRGASFLTALSGLFPGESPYDTLLSLMGKGLVYADSFVPVRQRLAQDKLQKATARQKALLRTRALHAGRWDITRPLKEQPMEKKLERCFDLYLILCRETAASCRLSWQEALSVLRIWEYTGQARRGYFVEGLSGAQFVRGKDYVSVLQALQNPDHSLRWINAADPAQCFGRLTPHPEGCSFLNVPGNLAAFRGGIPIAVLERQGKRLRVFDDAPLAECLRLFVSEYKKGRLFPSLRRIVVREYPKATEAALSEAGFLREMQDYVLYR